MSAPKQRSTVRHSRDGRPPHVMSLEAVYTSLAGGRESLRPLELREVVHVLTQRRMSARAIAVHVGCCQRTVERHRAALRGAR